MCRGEYKQESLQVACVLKVLSNRNVHVTPFRVTVSLCASTFLYKALNWRARGGAIQITFLTSHPPVRPNSIFSQFAQKCHPNEQQHRFPSFIHSVFSEDTLSIRHCSRYWKRFKDGTMQSRETEHVHKYKVKEDRRSKNELLGVGLGHNISLFS